MKELIILAGGLGTRLRSEVPDLPKCMAPVKGKPFIDFVIDYYISQKIEKFIFALGYKSEILQNHLTEKYPNQQLEFSLEEEPLGTGGAIKLACEKASEENVFITNGDTLFKVDVEALAKTHMHNKAECTLGLKPMQNFERFGVVKVDNNNCVQSFQEKQYYAEGLINGGFYALNIQIFLKKNFENKFSFEKDYLEQFVSQKKIFASVQDKYFIDMGIPEDYRRAAEELE
ncbi:nucleotidyltransferase family protein [Arachidicoccus soli]|uniref:Nucleotidyltransferase n=1 Tax=Arachidicoccus soli TaxID=2341117 RepID=A0A386HT51_9BACT|nr:nucleotidyltransferase family protein [Arachidicoccus soli]AYD48872.1 nucleotidyltransferase [Arachidicoccus soli]